MGLIMIDVMKVVKKSCWFTLGSKKMRIGISDMSTPIIVPAKKAIKQVLMLELLSYSKPLKA